MALTADESRIEESESSVRCGRRYPWCRGRRTIVYRRAPDMKLYRGDGSLQRPLDTDVLEVAAAGAEPAVGVLLPVAAVDALVERGAVGFRSSHTTEFERETVKR